MAVDAKEVKADYPLPIYNYRVEIGGTSIGFSEVSGLSISFEKHTYKESRTEGSQPGPRIFNFPAQRNQPTITLKKGLVPAKSRPALYDWINAITINQVQKKDIAVHLCDETGAAVVTWTISNAFPTKLDAPTFDANSNDVAIETIELMADQITLS